ncbi:MAG: hypothetical protein EZS28_043731 [Streblomastix strix]|uniref:Uncharacterized protein n=1 Tax=Streblomastix strix TaxID=222440 RepID=A0A5J4TTB8_9EUKA|nr:MAG: hypothetical protein EZS28_043731 [Streblomastix strix]
MEVHTGTFLRQLNAKSSSYETPAFIQQLQPNGEKSLLHLHVFGLIESEHQQLGFGNKQAVQTGGVQPIGVLLPVHVVVALHKFISKTASSFSSHTQPYSLSGWIADVHVQKSGQQISVHKYPLSVGSSNNSSHFQLTGDVVPVHISPVKQHGQVDCDIPLNYYPLLGHIHPIMIFAIYTITFICLI